MSALLAFLPATMMLNLQSVDPTAPAISNLTSTLSPASVLEDLSTSMEFVEHAQLTRSTTRPPEYVIASLDIPSTVECAFPRPLLPDHQPLFPSILVCAQMPMLSTSMASASANPDTTKSTEFA